MFHYYFAQKSLFGGLEEFDKSVEDSFSLKPNAKRLIIKPKESPNTSTLNASRNSLNISQQQENIPPQNVSSIDKSGKGNTFLLSGEADQSINPRRVSWLRSNLDKVSHHNRQSDSSANNSIQELVSTAKAKGAVEKGTSGSSPKLADVSIGNFASTSSGQKSVRFPAFTANDSILSTRSFLDDTSADLSLIGGDNETHPTGITLKRSGYYTIPSLDDLLGYLSEDGSCVVSNFTIGRKGYGCVYFDEPMDVAGLNLDELVHFRHKEVVIYPDDENKPPIGSELNRKAQITLDQVWPHDKTLHEPIKDRERLDAMDYEAKLRAVCDRHDTKFLEFRPETGSWVFRVDHFSKYGLSDSDDDATPVDPKKAKLNVQVKEAPLAGASTGAIPKQPLGKTTDAARNVYDADTEFGPQGLGGIERYDKCK